MNSNPEDRMNESTIPGPSDTFKESVLGAARTEWFASEQDEDISWFYPVLRLAASVAITFAALGLAGRSDERGREYAQFFTQPNIQRIELVSEFGHLSGGLGLSVNHATIAADPNSLLKRQTQLLELLNDARI